MKNQKQVMHRFIFFHKRIILIIYLLVSLFTVSCKQDASEEFNVMSGPFRQSIVETGELESVKASVITMPSLDWQYGYVRGTL
jgi:hypothetical protein